MIAERILREQLHIGRIERQITRLNRAISRGRAIMAAKVELDPRPPEPLANRLRKLVCERNRLLDQIA